MGNLHQIDDCMLQRSEMKPSSLTEKPLLYSFRRCPYAMRARLAITASGTSCRLREVVLRDKPQEMLLASPKATVPVLVLPDGRVIDESFDIMLHVLKGNDPQDWLNPPSGRLAEMQKLVDDCEQRFKSHLDRYKYSTRYDEAKPGFHRDQASVFLRELGKRLEKSSWLFGDRPTLADYAIFPFVRQFAQVDRHWFDQQNWLALHRWLTGFENSELFRSIMEKYPVWKPGDPEVEFPGKRPIS